jgi:hypothetical protein
MHLLDSSVKAEIYSSQELNRKNVRNKCSKIETANSKQYEKQENKNGRKKLKPAQHHRIPESETSTPLTQEG